VTDLSSHFAMINGVDGAHDRRDRQRRYRIVTSSDLKETFQ
jgi:hypothetical protein